MKIAENNNFKKCNNCGSIIPKDRANVRKNLLNVKMGYGNDVISMIEYHCPICNMWLFSDRDHEAKNNQSFDNSLKLPENVINDFYNWINPNYKDGNYTSTPKPLVVKNKPENINQNVLDELEKSKNIISKVVSDVINQNMTYKVCACNDNKLTGQEMTIYGSSEDIKKFMCEKCGGIKINSCITTDLKPIIQIPFIDQFGPIEPLSDREMEKMKELINYPINYHTEEKIQEVQKPKGTVIVIEGTDGSGKRTQAEMLLNKLTVMGVKASLYSFPNYDAIQGQIVKRYLNGEFKDQPIQDYWNDWYRNAILYANDRLVTCMEKGNDGKSILEKYNDGEVIIFDRYTQSNFIHQGCHIDDQEALEDFIDYFTDLEYNKLGLPEPDKVIYLRVSPEMSMQNIEKRGNEKDMHENLESLKKANKHTDFLIEWLGWDSIQCSDGTRSVDTGKLAYYMHSREDIHREVFSLVEETLVENNQLRHIKYCNECLKSNMYNQVKVMTMVNNQDLKIGVCPVCGAMHDITQM